MHTHTIAGMAVAAQRDGLLPISMTATGFGGRIAYHDYEGPSINLGERERLVDSLGDRNVLILRNHGILTCGKTIEEAFITCSAWPGLRDPGRGPGRRRGAERAGARGAGWRPPG